MSALAKHHVSLDEYLEGERTSDIRHEYFDGQVHAMAGGTSRHNAATLFFAGRLDAHLSGSSCQTFSSDFKIRIDFQGLDLFYYPDVFVSCESDDNHRLYREKPKFWLEVMSDDENKDRVEKYLVARRINSMEEFVIVSADPQKPEISIFRKSAGWEPPIVVKSGDVYFESVDIHLSVDELYRKLNAIKMEG